MIRRRRLRSNRLLWAALCITGGLTVGWLLSQVVWLAERANVAAPGTPITWLRAAAATLIVACAVAGVIGCLTSPDRDDRP